MGVNTKITDGTGQNKLSVKVKQSGNSQENALCANISGVTAGNAVPVFPFASGGQFESFLTLDGAGVTSEIANVDYTSPNQATFSLAPLDDYDLVITSMAMVGLDASIKMDNFLGRNGELPNGCELSIKSDNQMTQFNTIKSTFDMLIWSSPSGFDIFFDNAGDSLKATRIDAPLYILRSKGTFGTVEGSDDYIKLYLQDSLVGITSFKFLVSGVKVKKGVL